MKPASRVCLATIVAMKEAGPPFSIGPVYTIFPGTQHFRNLSAGNKSYLLTDVAVANNVVDASSYGALAFN